MEDRQIAQEFLKLINNMKKLRSPDGCPWDREQDYYSLKPYIIEEAYEVVECLEDKDIASLKKEIGDLLLQVIFQAQIGSEKDDFDIHEVLNLLNQKLIRRHPHVFAEKEINNVGEVLDTWNSIKKKEKLEQTSPQDIGNDHEESDSILSDISYSQPALNQAYELQANAAEIGFDWNNSEQVFKKIKEEFNELGQALEKNSANEIEEEIGDLLFSIVNLTRFQNLDPEVVLFSSILKFKKRFQYIEENIQKSDKDIGEYTLAELEELWIESKNKEKKMEE